MFQTITYKTMLRDRNYLKLILSGAISTFGDAVDTIAYGYMVFEMTGSAVLFAALFAVNGLPALIFSLVSGVAVSYTQKKSVVILCDLLRGAVVILTAVLYFTGGLAVWHLYVFTILNSTFEAFRGPASSMLFILLIDEERYTHAMSFRSSVTTFAELNGYAIAGLIIGVIGVSGAIILDGGTFLLSALLIGIIIMEKEIPEKKKLTLKVYFGDLKDGLQYAATQPLVRFLTFFFAGTMFLFSPFNALQTPYVLDNLQLGPEGISVLSISFMVAMMLGSLMIPWLTEKIGGRYVFVLGGIIVGIGFLSFGFIERFAGSFQGYIALAAASFVMGSTLNFVFIPISVAFMKKVDKTYMSRAYALSNVLRLSAAPLGAGVVGILINYVDISTMFYVTGVGIILIYAAQLFNKNTEEINLDKDG